MFINDQVRLKHIRDAAQEAVYLCQRRTHQELDSDRVLSLALVRLLEIIG